MNESRRPDPEFQPSPMVRHAHVQSYLASFKPRRWLRGRHAMTRAAVSLVLDCGDGVRLMGWHSPQPPQVRPRGLVVLIHGWEGCHDSVYLHSAACTLYDAGYNVFRLNLRDHGFTHHLNREMFHSARMAEVLGALHAIRRLDVATPFAVVGFSLGGNFTLRIALRGPAAGIAPDLCIAVCPAITPGATLDALDHGPRPFHRYFINKWRRSLAAKQAAWPDDFDFSDIRPLTNLREITARFVERYTEYATIDDYLAQYTLTPDMLLASTTPLAVITAQDDPVVPYAHFRGLRDTATLNFIAPARGGHCGFVENLRLSSWAERRVLKCLETL